LSGVAHIQSIGIHRKIPDFFDGGAFAWEFALLANAAVIPLPLE